MIEVFMPYQLSGEVLKAGGAIPLPPGKVQGIKLFSVWFGDRLASLVARAVTNQFLIVLSEEIASSACIEVI
jgi:hypothetical protein